MKPNAEFLNKPEYFWATVKIIGEELGYSNKRKIPEINTPSFSEIVAAFEKRQLDTSSLVDGNNQPSIYAKELISYFYFRSNLLCNTVKNLLMDKEEARNTFYNLKSKHNHLPEKILPKNKQKGDKQDYAFLTCIVNILIYSNIGEYGCDYDPRRLTSVTQNGVPVQTLSRRVDGALPNTINPIAIWEIKEYYNTKTFGSRVADGIYETLLDGMEINMLEASGNKRIDHILIVDSFITWWEKGRSYLCRIIDMLHMGYVDEVIFGKEALHRIPKLVEEWNHRMSTSYRSSE